MSSYDPQDFSGSQVNAGGYLNSPGIATQNSSTAKTGRFAGDSSLIPVTVKQITTAPEPEPDAPFMIDGRDSFNVTIIGAITHIEMQVTNTAITLSDGTDEIAVKIWTSEESRAASDLEKLKELQKGMYIKVFGRPQLYRGARSLTCYHLDVIKDSNELTLHLVESLYAHLMNTNSNTKRMNSNAFGKGSSSTVGDNNTKKDSDSRNSNMRKPLGDSYNIGSSVLHGSTNTHLSGATLGTGDIDEDVEMNDLERKIISVIKNPIYSSTDGGCHIEEVFKDLPQYGVNDIKEAVQRLSDDGQLYSTIDDEHFKPTH